MINKLLASAAAAALVAAPVAAQAAPDRASAPVESGDEQLFGNFVLPIVIAIAVAVGIWLMVDGDDDPVSP